MTRRTRYFLSGAAAVTVAGLAAGLVAYNGGFPAISASPTGGPSELAFVPADASVVAYANIRDVMTSEFRQRLKAAVPDVHEHNDFEQKTGINLETDVDYIVAWMGPDGTEANGLVLARGRFNDGQLEALAREHGGEVMDYRGKRLVTGRFDRDDDAEIDEGEAEAQPRTDAARRHRDGALAFLDTGLVAVGEQNAIKKAIDAQATGQNISGNVDMMKLVSDIEAGSNAWAVGRLDALRERHRLPEPVSNQLSAVKWFAATGRINGGVSGTFRAEARDEQAAENLRDVVRGFLALARMQAGSNPKYAGMLQSLQLSGSGNTVAVSFEIPVEILDLVAPHRRGIE
jgi:hypothetical protein